MPKFVIEREIRVLANCRERTASDLAEVVRRAAKHGAADSLAPELRH
jgi:hypothetical protein